MTMITRGEVFIAKHAIPKQHRATQKSLDEKEDVLLDANEKIEDAYIEAQCERKELTSRLNQKVDLEEPTRVAGGIVLFEDGGAMAILTRLAEADWFTSRVSLSALTPSPYAVLYAVGPLYAMMLR